MASILDEIIAHKRAEVAALKARVARHGSRVARVAGAEEGPRFRDAIASKPEISLIAEIKRRSPTAGDIRPDLDPVDVARVYEESGAAAISCLTDEKFFGGSFADLESVSSVVGLPVLCKDFIIDEYQIAEAKAHGAAGVLLIAAVLSESELAGMLGSAGGYGLDPLVEVHDSEELRKALGSGVSLIGVNNRDLRTFEVDIETSLRLADEIPSNVFKITESGIRTRADVERFENAGFDAFLVGETLLRSDDIAAKISELLGRARSTERRAQSTATDN